MKILRIICVFGGFLSVVLSLSAQTFTSLDSFAPPDVFPVAPLVQATNGDLYGTTFGGPPYGGDGTVFKITRRGALTTVQSFGSTDGADPAAGLVQATNGNLYGTTAYGGPVGSGTIFKIAPNGEVTTLYNFSFTDGAYPYAGLVQASNGELYGTTQWGGPGNCYTGCGTVFKITLNGNLTNLYNFCSQDNCTDGSEPYAALVQANNGSFYGTTSKGGDHGYGTVFKITASGTLRTLYSFCSQSNCTDGANPVGALIQATDGNLYGMTSSGGTYGYGTVFKITASGTLTTFYSFCSQSNCTDGVHPSAGLIEATDGYFYGTASSGGANDGGTIFSITSRGKLTTLYNFCSVFENGLCTDGNYPAARLVQDTDGIFYGTTKFGGTHNHCAASHGNLSCGTVFSLSVGLGPFIETNPASGKVGTPVKILGTDLTGATSVTFNGTEATFTFVSASEIKTAVPDGATTGTVEVTTPKGTLKSNVVFRVTQ